ncbi:u3 small nucleolar ribonucleoprotein MPP10 [Coelomomyces lativittatus]|nr:u3 small nucleolar ribonucleoprotein MPP10 [Coelomomyces lativittatus]KAJ1510453.1 u3 small nucleolar ribonucleoprotein MPP10 [Coelomomyces lativittatus]KAJ1512287.1 u3 small nucleolar ribonucleoprotein MPP10 [Coelomomyces lativittatus]
MTLCTSDTYHFDHPTLTKLVDLVNADPEAFLTSSSSADVSSLYPSTLQTLPIFYHFLKQQEPSPGCFGPIQRLMVNGFDTEQIWAQVHTLNQHVFKYLDHPPFEIKEEDMNSESEVQMNEDIDSPSDSNSEVDSGSNSEVEETMDESDEKSELSDEADVEVEPSVESDTEKSIDSDIPLDDQVNENGLEVNETTELTLDPSDPFGFYAEDKLAEMKEDSDQFDEEELQALDDQAAQCTYDDFFGPSSPPIDQLDATVDALDDFAEPLQNKVANLFLDVLDLEEEQELEDGFGGMDPFYSLDQNHQDEKENNDEKEPHASLSTFEKHQAMVQKQVSTLEAEALEEKKWTLKGEVTSKQRPLNSLLEEVIDFECVRQPVPVISESYTRSIEDMIQSRIQAQQFDNVEPPLEVHQPAFVPKETVSDEKSKLSLAEVYEQEYLDRVRTDHRSQVVEAITQQHEEIQQLEKNLFYQLDALAHFYYTPPPPVTLVSSTPASSNLPAILVEESIPSHVSTASLVTPAEIFKPSNQWKGQEELSRSDKAQLRKKSKVLRKQKVKDTLKLKSMLNRYKEETESTPTTNEPRVH